MDDWLDVTVGEIAALSRNALVGGPFGSNLVSSDYADSGVPVIRGQNMGGRWVSGEFAFVSDEKALELSANLARPCDIVFTQRGTLGQVSLVPDKHFSKYVISQSQMKLTVNQKLADPLFVYYVFTTVEQQEYILQNAIQTGVPHTNLGILRTTPLRLPSLKEQQAIATILGALDDKIELNRRTNETLEAMARAIFKDWFVDFGPTRAKMEGRAPYLAPEICALFPNRLDDHGKPEGWDLKPLSELCTLGRGASPRPINDYMNGEVPWIKIADATAARGPFLFETKEKVKIAGAEMSVAVTPGDLILSNSATCGVPVFVELHGCIHDGWLYFKNLKAISKLYLFHILIELATHLIQIADGSVQKNLNTNLVGRQNVVVPSKAIIDAFDAQAGVCFAKMRQNGFETRALAATRDLLLPKLMSGEIRLRKAEKAVEAVA
jgi:type I restriction enzyme S subunit